MARVVHLDEGMTVATLFAAIALLPLLLAATVYALAYVCAWQPELEPAPSRSWSTRDPMRVRELRMALPAPAPRVRTVRIRLADRGLRAPQDGVRTVVDQRTPEQLAA
jgi:hypothetical protein